MTIPKSIAIALVRAQKAAHTVGKDGKNTFHGYKYASAESIITEARAALGEAGLACACVGWDWVRGADDDTDRVIVRYILASESEGETWECAPCSTPVLPEKGRPEDKAEATALTYNLGYFLRGLLLLPRVEEGAEVDTRDDSRAQPRRQRGAAKADPEALAMAFESAADSDAWRKANDEAKSGWKTLDEAARAIVRKAKTEATARLKASEERARAAEAQHSAEWAMATGGRDEVSDA